MGLESRTLRNLNTGVIERETVTIPASATNSLGGHAVLALAAIESGRWRGPKVLILDSEASGFSTWNLSAIDQAEQRQFILIENKAPK